jgi:hypothetical protein
VQRDNRPLHLDLHDVAEAQDRILQRLAVTPEGTALALGLGQHVQRQPGNWPSKARWGWGRDGHLRESRLPGCKRPRHEPGLGAASAQAGAARKPIAIVVRDLKAAFCLVPQISPSCAEPARHLIQPVGCDVRAACRRAGAGTRAGSSTPSWRPRLVRRRQDAEARQTEPRGGISHLLEFGEKQLEFRSLIEGVAALWQARPAPSSLRRLCFRLRPASYSDWAAPPDRSQP